MPERKDDGYLDELGFSAATQAVMPTAQERGPATLDSLPQHIKDAIASGELTPSYASVRVRDGRGGEGYEAQGDLVGFSSLSPDDIETSYDLQGNVTGTRKIDRTGGWIGRLTPGLTMAALAAMGGAGISDLLGAGAAGAGADALGSAIVEGGGSDVLGGLAEFGGFPSLEASEAAAFPNAIGVNAGLDAAAASVAAPTAATLAEFGGFPSLEASEAAAFPNAIGANAGLDAATAAGTASHLTPAAIESLSGTPGYGTNASALQYALDNGLPTNLVGAGALAGGLNFADLTKGASTINSLLNSFKQGATLGSLDGSNSSGSSSGSRLGSDLARVGQMGSGNSLLHAVQGLYSGSPTGFAEGGSTNSGLDNYNPLKGDTVKVGDVGKNITLSRELASLYGDNALAHGGQPHVDPRLMALIRARANTADKQHPNYDGTPVFRTGGLEGLGGKYVEGNGDGQSDDIPAMLADGEYVFDAQTVADFGNGSNKAGAKMLDAMREAIRAHKRNSPLDSIPPKSKTPEQYLMDARKYLKGVK